MNIKRIILAAALNAILILGVFCTADYLAYLKYKKAFYKNNSSESLSVFSFPGYIKSYKADFPGNTVQFFKNSNMYQLMTEAVRKPSIDSSFTKPPVIIFGCSYAYGFLLDDDKTIHFKLSELTKRNVYNFALCACGIQHMLYILQHNFFDILDNQNPFFKNPEYAVFVYIPHHLKRLQASVFACMENSGANLEYEFNNNKLKVKNYLPDSLYKTYLLKTLYAEYDRQKEKNLQKYKYDSFMLANEIFIESKRLLEEKFPGIKFIILNYQSTNDESSDYELPFMFDVLKQEGFIVVNSEDLIGRKFEYNSADTVKDGYHPSEKAWDLLLPEMVKKLNL